jgi:hypothetical protein
MKKISGWIIAVAALFAVVPLSFAQTINLLGNLDAARYGATHWVQVEYSDFTEDTTNTAETFTLAVPAKSFVEIVGARLLVPFDTANTNYTGSLAMQVGDEADADKFLASMELASDGSEVFGKYGRDLLAMTQTTGLFATNLVLQTVAGYVGGVAVTNAAGVALSFVTNATIQTTSGLATSTIGSSGLGRVFYSGATNVVFTFTPNAEEALDSNTVGHVEVFLRILDN